MAQLDDDVGVVMKKLNDIGVDDNTIVVFTTDNGTEVFTWPDGGQTPFAQSKGTVLEGGFRVPAIRRWLGDTPADSVQNGIFSGLDWLPTFAAAAGNPNITEELLKGKTIGDRTYRNHLDGYNQMAAITGKGLLYVTKSSTSAKAQSVLCELTTISIASSTNPMAGWVIRPIQTCPTSPTFAWIPLSGPAGPTMERKTVRSNISIGSSSSSGALCSSSS
jgi:arylsulfatase